MKRLFSLFFVYVLSITFSFSTFALEEITVPGEGTITGEIKVKGKGSMGGGTVFFFRETSGPPPSDSRYWRVPTDASSIDEHGRFIAMLPEGNYYMGAIKRFSGEALGPPQHGDFFFISQDEKGNPRLHAVKKNTINDTGVISEAVPFNRDKLVTEGVTSIQGIIVDGEGNPVEGMLVFAFPTQVMFGRPLFVSERSKKDGTYLLRLYEGGEYYLSSRANYGGGPPTANQSMGSYANGQSIIVKTGESKKGIDITVRRVGVTQ